MTETEKKLLLELASWVEEEEEGLVQSFKECGISWDKEDRNSHTPNIKELVREIIKKNIAECENAPQQTPFDMVAFANGLFDRKETANDQEKE